MEITPEQKVTSDNFKAHILSLKNELRIVSEELDSKMRLKEISSKQLEELSVKEINVLSRLHSSEKRIEEIKKREEELLINEEQLKVDYNEFKIEKGEEEKKIKVHIENYKKAIKKFDSQIEDLIKEVSEKKSESDKLELIKEKLFNEIKDLIDSKGKILNEIDLLEIRYNDEIIAHNKVILGMGKEIEQFKKELDIAREKVSKPMESFEAEKLEFGKEYKNFIIRKKRLEKFVRQYFPGQVLKI